MQTEIKNPYPFKEGTMEDIFEEYGLKEEEKVEPTALQRQIEKNVTNGLGYDSETRLYDTVSCVVREDEVKNSPTGLKAHLADMDLKINPSEDLRKFVEFYKKLAGDITGSGEFPPFQLDFGSNNWDRKLVPPTGYPAIMHMKMQENVNAAKDKFCIYFVKGFLKAFEHE